jgi:hypothetical protein
MSNLYANSINRDNPSIVWNLDEDLSTVTSLSALPSDIALSAYGTPASYYGSGQKNAYYLGTSADKLTLKSTSFGVPLVYGSSSIINLYPNSGNPSFIFPGFGLLNYDGKDKNITLEFWMRILPDTHYPRRIVGPINSDDGLYVNGPFISLKIENTIKHHFVGEWGRPMLIQIFYTRFSAGLMLNGEQVISILHDGTNLQLVDKFDQNGDDQDWIGIYAYDNVTPIQIDCIAIYPYQISQKNAKLHFVKGQAVEVPEIRNISYTSVPTVIDYQAAKYSNNYTYPGAGKWQNGIIDNLGTVNNVLSAPDYALPTITFQDQFKTLDEWYTAQSEINTATTSLSDGQTINNDVFFRINPMVEDEEWNSEGYIYFNKLNVIQEDLKSFYGVFSVATLPASEQVLLKVTNQSGESFQISINGNDLYYKFISGTSITTTTVSDVVTTNTKFSVGVDIDELISNNPELKSFFYNKASLQLFVGGMSGFNKTFAGNIYKIGFCNSVNSQKISSDFTNGILLSSSTKTPTHYASYTLVGVYTFNKFELDIAINGSWKDYIPAKILAKQTSENNYSLDFIQINIDYPEISNVTNSFVRSYVEFSDTMSSIVSSNQITKTNLAKETDYVIEPTADWTNKKYEFVDHTILYLPAGGYGSINDLSIVSHIEFFVPGIIRNPVGIKTYQLSSQSLIDSTTPTPIGTRYGKDIYSYGTSGYNTKNPYSIYKGSTPYLYLTKNSGIKLVGSTFDATREISIPINEFGKKFYTVSTIQASIFHEKNFGDSPIEIFRIKNNTGTIIILATPNEGGLTATLSATKSGEAYVDVDIYLNGKEEAVIRYKEWNLLTLQFKKNLDFGNVQVNKISITGPFLVNNVSDYQIIEAKINENVFLQTWSTVWNAGVFDWQDYTSGNWKEDVLESGILSIPQLDPELIHNAYIGQNIIAGNNGSKLLNISQNTVRTYSGIRSSSIIITPL